MNHSLEKTLPTVTQMDSDSSDEPEKKSRWQRFITWIEVQPKGDLTNAQMFLYNFDLRPVEEERRLWSWYNFVFFWIADSFNINTWQIAATGILAGGMNWWQTWLSVWLGYFLCGIFVSISSRVVSFIIFHFLLLLDHRLGFMVLFGRFLIEFSCRQFGMQFSVPLPVHVSRSC